MNTHRLDFLNVEMNDGLNLTCRLGRKWADSAKCMDLVEVYETGADTPAFYGNISGSVFMRFRDIPESFLQYEHDKSCRTLDGLETAMQAAYGSAFSRDSFVTLLFFDLA